MKRNVISAVVLGLALILSASYFLVTGPSRTTAATVPALQLSSLPKGTPAVDGRYQILPGSSSASYAVKETFLRQQRNETAVGQTSAVSGELVVQDGTLKPSKVTVDLTSLSSDSAKRDDALKTKGLHTNKFPLAEFEIVGVEGDQLIFGEEGPTFTLLGTMTIHGTSRPLTFQASAGAELDSVLISAVAQFNMTDFGIEPPSVLGLISVEEEIQLHVELVAKVHR